MWNALMFLQYTLHYYSIYCAIFICTALLIFNQSVSRSELMWFTSDLNIISSKLSIEGSTYYWQGEGLNIKLLLEIYLDWGSCFQFLFRFTLLFLKTIWRVMKCIENGRFLMTCPWWLSAYLEIFHTQYFATKSK